MLTGYAVIKGQPIIFPLIKYKGIYIRKGFKPDISVVDEYDSTYKNLRKYFNHDSVLDIGANIGVFSYKVLETNRGAKIVCYEPEIGAYSVLKYNITSDRCLLSERAITKDGLDVTISIPSTGNSVIAATAFSSKGRTNLKVNSVSFIEAVCQSKCSLLKVDCEGAELDWLYGDKIPSHVNVVIAELHRWKEGWEAKCKRIIESFKTWKPIYQPKSFQWNKCYLIAYER